MCSAKRQREMTQLKFCGKRGRMTVTLSIQIHCLDSSIVVAEVATV